MTTDVNFGGYKYFALSNTGSTITLQISVSGAAEVYLQFQQFANEVASFFNVAQGTSDAIYYLNNSILNVGANT